jgi:hypothetical protein
MDAARRSHLFRIATICLAVLLGQTAYAAKPARSLSPGTPPPHVKLTSAQPEPRKNLPLAAKKVQRPRVAQRHSASFPTAGFVPASIAASVGTLSPGAVLRTRHALCLAPQFRLFALRI